VSESRQDFTYLFGIFLLFIYCDFAFYLLLRTPVAYWEAGGLDSSPVLPTSMQLHLANPHSKEGQDIDYEETRRLKERNNNVLKELTEEENKITVVIAVEKNTL
jgi:hypothetical protein